MFGYNEDERGRLIRSDAPEQILSGNGKETVGPGDYDVKGKGKVRGITKWQASRTLDDKY